MQNRVQIAEAQLPAEVQSEGITVRAASSTFVLAVSLFSPTSKYGQLFISNYEYMKLQQIIARIPGVGNTQIFGQREYAMRVWLNPVQMTGLGITTAQVIAAIEAQNIQVSAGQIGEPPVQRRPAAATDRAGAGRADQRGCSSRISSSAPTRAAASSGSRTSRAVELAAQGYTTSSTLDQSARRDAGGVSGAERQCAAGLASRCRRR